MASKSVQELVKKLFSEEETRAQFEKDPESILARFSLSDKDKRSMLATYKRIGLANKGSTSMEATIEPLIFWL
jgi:hypothetical protein